MGWCFFEMSVSCSSNRIANADNRDVALLLENTGMPLGFFSFLWAFWNKKFTGQGDWRKVLRLFFNVIIWRLLAEASLYVVLRVLLPEWCKPLILIFLAF